MERFGLVGISHRRGTAAELARFTRRPSDFADLQQALQVDELLVLSTCNRVEVIYFSEQRLCADRVLQRYLNWLFGEDPQSLEWANGACYAVNGSAAAKQLFATICGLNSLVLGDQQIVGQFRQALQQARDRGLCKAYLGLLADTALKVSKRARPTLNLRNQPTSIAEVAAQKLRQRASGHKQFRVALVGSGPMVQEVGERLSRWQCAHLHFVNRTLAKAEQLAQKFGGTVQSLGEFQAAPQEFDALLAATAAPSPLLSARHFASFHPFAKERVLIDLGMPANLHADLEALSGFQLLDLMTLGREAAAGQREVELASRKVRPHLRTAIQEMQYKLSDLDFAPSAQHLRVQAEAQAERELRRWLGGQFQHLGAEDREKVSEFARHLAQQTAQIPIRALRQWVRKDSLPVAGTSDHGDG